MRAACGRKTTPRRSGPQVLEDAERLIATWNARAKSMSVIPLKADMLAISAALIVVAASAQKRTFGFY
jgi:hypothetical protein